MDSDNGRQGMTGRTPEVAGRLVRKLVDHLESLGVDRAQLLAGAGIEPRTLRLTTWRLPWSMVEELQQAERMLDAPTLGLRLAQRQELETLGLPGLLFFASSDVGSAIRRLVQFSHLWSDAYRIEIDDGPAPRYRFSLCVPERRASRHLRDNHLAAAAMVLRDLVGDTLPMHGLVRVELEHAAEGRERAYETAFPCPVEFGAKRTSLALHPDALAVPLPSASQLFERFFEQQALTALDRLGARSDSVLLRLQSLLEHWDEAELLHDASLRTAARDLGISVRSLQRHLGRAGSTFSQELSRHRQRRSLALLRAGSPIPEVALRLGYADTTTFHRAFRRWMGTSPEAWLRDGAP